MNRKERKEFLFGPQMNANKRQLCFISGMHQRSFAGDWQSGREQPSFI